MPLFFYFTKFQREIMNHMLCLIYISKVTVNFKYMIFFFNCFLHTVVNMFKNEQMVNGYYPFLVFRVHYYFYYYYSLLLTWCSWGV